MFITALTIFQLDPTPSPKIHNSNSTAALTLT